MAFYYPPTENLPTFDVKVFRDAQDVVEYAVTTGTSNTTKAINTTTLPSGSAFYYIPYLSSPTGANSQILYTGSAFYYNPASGILAGSTLNLFGGFANVSATAAARAINNTFYNLYDNTAVSGGVIRGNLTTTSTVASLNLNSATHRFTITNNSGALTPFLIDPTDLTIVTTNNPTISGFTSPASSDSTSKIATTAWVQSAITGGTSGTASAINTTTMPASPPAVDYYFPYITSATGASSQIPYANGNIFYNSGNNTLNVPNLTSGNTFTITNATSNIITTGNAVDLLIRTLATTGGSIILAPRGTTALTISSTGVATFISLPECSTAPTTANQLTNKTYVDTKVSLTGNQTIAGIKTFSSLPECSTAPTTANQLTNFTYVNTKVSLTGNETIAGIKTFSSVPVCSTAPTTANQLTNKTYVDSAITAAIPTSLLGLNNTWTGTNQFNNSTTMKKPLTINGTLDTDRIINNVYYQFQDKNTLATTTGQMYSSSGAIIFDNDINSGSYSFSTNTAGGTQVTPFTFSAADLTITTTNCPTQTGYTLSAGTDNTNKIATNAWVQTAITAGTAGVASQVTLANTASGSTNYLVMSTTNTGASSLLTDNSGATYDSTTNTAVINVSGNANTVSVAVNNTATIHYPIFATAGAGQKSLLFDTTTTALTYQPSTSTLKAFVFSIDALGRYEFPTTIASSMGGFGTDVAISNNNIGGAISFQIATAGLPLTFFSVTEAATVMTNPTIVTSFGSGASSTKYFKVNESAGVGISIVPNAGSGSYNSLVVLNDSVILGERSAVDTGNLTLTTWSGTTTGVRITPTTALIGAGGAGATPNSSVSCSGTTVTITGNPVVTNRNILVNNGSGFPLTIGNGASTATDNVIIASFSLATTRNFTTGGNVVIGNLAGNALVVASANNTILGDESGGSALTGNRNICIGYQADVPTAAGNNQIAIGTSLETMFIRGGFNLRVGAQITNSTNGNLATAVLAQFYTVAMTAAGQTITLPNPTTAAYLGATVTFKRKTNTTAYTLTSTGGAGFLPIGAIGLSASPHTVAAGVFQVTIISDGVNWCIINQA